MTIEIGKEYIYNNEIDNSNVLKKFHMQKCIVCETGNKFREFGTYEVLFLNNEFPYLVDEKSLTPMPETPCETCEDHDSHDCAICTKPDDSKYKRAWEALPERLGGKIKVSTLVIILNIMDEVLKDEQ